MQMLSFDQKKLVDSTYCKIIVDSANSAMVTHEDTTQNLINQLESDRKFLREGLEKVAATFNAARDEIYNKLDVVDKSLPGSSGFTTMELSACVEGPIGEPVRLYVKGVRGSVSLTVTPTGSGTYVVRRDDENLTTNFEGVLDAMGKVLALAHPHVQRLYGKLNDARRKFPDRQP